MNTTHGVMPFPVTTWDAVTIDPSPNAQPWPGLEAAAGQVGVCLNTLALDRFVRYAELLLLGNSQFNLTGMRDRAGVERTLFLNALAIVRTLDAFRAHAETTGNRLTKFVDIGAGAGLPGLPLKIARPDLDLTLVDATAKKVDFLNGVIADLGLDQARAIHGRAEELGQHPAYRETFDFAAARAVASLPVLLEYVVPFLAVGGTALMPKGLEIDEELRRGRHAATTLGADITSADRLPVDGSRLIVAAKVHPTPSMYPRRVGIPSRSPLGEGF